MNEARRRKDSLTYSDGNTEIISRSRSGTTVEVKPHVAGSSAPRSPLLRNSIKLFEQKAQENAKPAPRNTAIKKKAASARFYPVVSEKPPEVVKSSPAGSKETQYSKSTGSPKVSQLARAFESSSDENESPRKPSKASRSSSDEPNSDSKIQPKEEPKLESPKKVQEESLKPVQISKEPESPKKPEKEPDVQVTSSDKPETVKGESKQPEPVTTPEPEVNDSKEPEEIKEEKENDGESNNNKEVSLDNVDEEKEEKDNIDSPKESSSKSKEDEEEKEDAVKMKEEEKEEEEEGDTPNVSPKTEEESKPEETDDKEVDDNEDDKGDKKPEKLQFSVGKSESKSCDDVSLRDKKKSPRKKRISLKSKKDKEKDKIISSGSDKESDIPSSPTIKKSKFKSFLPKKGPSLMRQKRDKKGNKTPSREKSRSTEDTNLTPEEPSIAPPSLKESESKKKRKFKKTKDSSSPSTRPRTSSVGSSTGHGKFQRSSTIAVTERPAFLDSLDYADQSDEFLGDSEPSSPKTKSFENNDSLRESGDSVDISSETPSSENVSKKSLKKSSSSLQKSSGHKRHISMEDVSSMKTNIEEPLVSPRDIDLDAPRILSHIIIPVCSLPMSGDWESKKIRNAEKIAKQQTKEKKILEIEEEASKSKIEQDTANHIQILSKKQQEEKSILNKKIKSDKTTLSINHVQEKKALTALLKKEKDDARSKLNTEHDKDEKERTDAFEKQIQMVKKANKGASDSFGAELFEHLKNTHDTNMKQQNYKKLLSQMQMLHKHEKDKLKRIQELEKKQIKEVQKMEREILIQQLSQTQKHLRQRRWVVLDDVRNTENAHQQLLEKRQQLEIRHENAAQDAALKLLLKQQLMEVEYFSKNFSTHQKQGNVVHQRQKKQLKAVHQANINKLKRDKNLTREECKTKIDDLQAGFDSQMAQLEEQFVSSQSSDIQDQALKKRHTEQLAEFKKEKVRRYNVLLLYHQKEKNVLHNRLMEERKDIELELKKSIEEFQKEEQSMKEAFTEANETNLWSLQQRHWVAMGEKQAANHEEQNNFMVQIQEEQKLAKEKAAQLAKERAEREKAARLAKSSEDNDKESEEAEETNDEEEEAEIARRMEEQRKLEEEQLALQAELERQLEEQQEAEKKQLEIEREEEQARLKAQIQEETKEVMNTRIEEDENSLRLEYIRKVANETGLSEELIAAQVARIGIPSFMF